MKQNSSVDTSPSYQARKKIYPQSVRGRFRNLKWAVVGLAFAVFYLAPFLRWNRGVHAPDQAILLDFPSRRFYFFFLEIWPDEIYYLTGLLILAAITLFLMNALAGRVWCGYFCPQTIWTDLFFAVERFFEGDHREHMKRDAGPWNMDRLWRFIGKHIAWLFIAMSTGIAAVLYFADAPTLLKEILTLQAPSIAYIWIGILTFTTYIFAGWMREQLCIYMCPWPRIQAALIDENALNVTYRVDRGEPRFSMKKAEALRANAEPAGDCIDCNQCVLVCPTGTDIRKGMQLSCIQCALCIDACDTVMDKVGRSRGLIAYDTDINIRRREEGKPEFFQLFRPRTLLYSAIIMLISLGMLYQLTNRLTVDIYVQHDRVPQFVRLSDGSLRNGYTIKIGNRQRDYRTLVLSVEGLPDASLRLVGSTNNHAGAGTKEKSGKDNEAHSKMIKELPDHALTQTLEVSVGPDRVEEMRVLVFSKNKPKGGATNLKFQIEDPLTGEKKSVPDTFRGPR